MHIFSFSFIFYVFFPPYIQLHTTSLELFNILIRLHVRIDVNYKLSNLFYCINTLSFFCIVIVIITIITIITVISVSSESPSCFALFFLSKLFCELDFLVKVIKGLTVNGTV
jgi:hypothetical protein